MLTPSRKTILALLLISTVVAIHPTAAAPSLVRGNLAALRKLMLGSTARLTVRTPEGLQEIYLRRHTPRRQPLLRVNNSPIENSEEIARPLLFQGRLLNRRAQNPRSRALGVAADLYKGKLRIHFYGKRTTRLYTANLNLARHSVMAEISHLPSSFPIACAVKAAGSASAGLNIGHLAIIGPAKFQRSMDLAMDADLEYFESIGSNLNATSVKMEQIANTLDGIFSSQLGISSTLVAQNVFTDVSQPYQTSDAEDLRDEFAEYRNSNSFGVGFDSANLLTGKTIFVPGFSESIAGISYLSIYPDYSDPGTVCRYDNQYSYTVVRGAHASTTYAAILIAHEIGHNLSLFHTDSGIMLGAPAPDNTSFASDSLSSVFSYLDEFGSCLPIAGPAISLTSARVRSGKFSSTFAPVNYAGEPCRLKVYGSKNRYDLFQDARRHSTSKLLISKVVSSQTAKKFEGKVGMASKGSKIKYYLIGELECNGEITATSEIRDISSNVRDFLATLKSALKKRTSSRRR